MIGRGIGNVVRTLGELVEARLPFARLGDGVSIRPHSGAAITGRVIAIRDRLVTLAPLGPLDGIAVGDRVEADPLALAALLGTIALGRAFDPAQTPLDEGAPLAGRRRYVGVSTPSPAERRPIDSPLWTGIRVIDGLLTIGRGARVGIFGEPGAGKSTLLEMIVQGVAADAVVLALIGERGREAQTWLERIDRRTTLICATADRSAGERMRAAELAMLQAEQLRAQGLHVVLVVDSLARYVAALREQRISLGEPVGRGGYPAAVFAELARYLERAGNDASGSISVVATVLSDGADEREPLSDAARSLLDGHFALSHDLARAGYYPAIDVLASTSRTMGSVVDAVHREDAALVREAMTILARTADARRLGLADASDARLRQAMEIEPLLSAFLRQREADDPANSRRLLADLASHFRR
ncbi:MAG TPA: ATP-binding cassette domain-containing protein [Candidatus Baltobacteraceae bacterium]|jgi:FliI/YscN family ATPase|nr:ATP-binding cassette domain-containing protein [Candidatus Baltobacteraceae bacterium]